MPSAVEALWAANALWPGAAIVARLRDQVPDLRAVLMVDEFDPAAAPAPRQLPSAIVLLDGMRVVQRPAGAYGLPLNCEQDWMVALAVRSARADADAASAEAGALLPQVVAALHGYVPQGAERGFAWRTGPRPVYGASLSYYPLIFTLQEAKA
jgi:hypothetical protein